MTTKVWVDEGLRDADEAAVGVFDHGFTVGDGVFETCKVTPAGIFALNRHLERLVRSATGLGLPAPDPELVRRACLETVAANGVGPLGRLRITYTGGASPLGSARGDARPTLVVAVAPCSPTPPTTTVITVEWPRNERSALAGLKTTSYAENVVALARATAAGASEALLPNTLGNLCEGTGSNVFCVLDGELVTPPLSAGPLAGITRALVLEWVGGTERDVPMADLLRAEEVFLTSSLRDVQAVTAVDGRPLPAGPGPVTARAARVLAERAAAEPEP